MADKWSSISTGISGPARNAASVAPSDSTDLPDASRAIYIGGSGDISIVTVGGDTVTMLGVPAGSMLPICAARIRATGTTATGIIAFW